MAIELIKRPVTLCKNAGIVDLEEMVEDNIIVPDTKPDILEICMIDSEVLITDKVISGQILEIRGEILYKIMYKAENAQYSIECIVTKCPFKIPCRVPETEGEIKEKIKAYLEHTDYEILNGRKINIKSVIKIICVFKVCQPMELGCNIVGEEVEQRSEKINAYNLVNSCEDKIRFTERAELNSGKPEIYEILMYDCKLLKKGFTFRDDEMVVTGDARIEVLYKSDREDQGYETYNVTIPFAKGFPIEEVPGGSYEIGYVTNDVEVIPIEDLDGVKTIIEARVEMTVKVWAYQTEEIEKLTDAYGLETEFELEKGEMEVCKKAENYKEDFQVREIVELENAPEGIEEVYLAICKPSVSNYSCNNGAITVNGTINCSIIYGVGFEYRELKCVQLEIPFEKEIKSEFSGDDMEYDFEITVTGTDNNIISENQLEIMAEVSMLVMVIQKDKTIVVTDLRNIRSPEVHEKSGFVIYYTQPGDTLWDIAKKYRTTPGRIKKVNQMDEDYEPQVGNKMFISV